MKARRLFLAFFLLSLSARCASAGIEASMSSEEWFKRSNKILVLEYESPLGGEEGAQLSQLIGRMALATTRGVDNLALVSLRQEKVRIPLTETNVKALAEKQRAPVVIWGEFYQQNDRIFVTSHLRYSPHLSPRNFGRATGPNASKLSLDISKLKIPGHSEAYASLPSVQINFSPIEISSADLSSLQNVWRKTLTLHEGPTESSREIGELALDTPYYVKDTSNGWTQVVVRDRPGWARLADLNQLKDFNDLTGSVLYAQGLMQHVLNNPRAAEKTFKQYLDLEKYSSKQDSMNRAVAHLLVGYSRLRASSDWNGLLREFEAAKALLPNVSSPINCMALALFAKAGRSAPGEDETLALEKDLIRAVQTEGDADAIRNLEILYLLPQAEAHFKKKNPDFIRARDTQLNLLRNLARTEDRAPNG